MCNIHSTAIVSKKSTIDNNAIIGPYCIIGDNVTISKGVNLISHVTINKNTFIDENTIIYPFTTIGFIPQDLKFDNEETRIIIGKNNTIREHVTIHLATKSNPLLSTIIGDNCLIMVGTHIAHDCRIYNNVILANNVMLAGHCIIEEHVVVGGGSAVHQHSRIGKYSMIGGMSGVGHDIMPYALYTGSRESGFINGINLIGLKRAGFKAEQINNIREAFDILFLNKNEKQFSDKVNILINKFKNNSEVDSIISFIQAIDSRSLNVRYKKNK